MSDLFKAMKAILPRENKIIYDIPEFQRDYSWGKEQWEPFFNDICENDEGYFVGSIICISRPMTAPDSPIHYDVIDGQQRLTTISLFLLALKTKIKKDDIRDDFGLIADYQEMESMLRIGKGETAINRLVLQQGDASESTKKDYEWLVENVFSEGKAANKPNHFGNRRISLAYEFFIRKIEALNSAELMSILKKILYLQVVSINVTEMEKAFQIFETVNNRGLALSRIDLIKNTLIKYAAADKKSIEFNRRWKSIFNQIGEDTKSQERFLRQYYNACVRDASNDALKTKARQANLIALFENLLNDDYSKLVDKLEEAAEIYGKISANIECDSACVYKNEVLDLFHADGTTSYILLLYLVKEKNSLGIDDMQIKSVIKMLTRFFVIRTITDTPPTRELNDLFIKIIDEIKSKTGNDVYLTIAELLKNSQKVSQQVLEDALRDDVYIKYQSATRFLLSLIEIESTGIKGQDHDQFWMRDNKGRLAWTIEHVMPETQDGLPDAWVDMIAAGDKNKAREVQIGYMHKLGNLTLTSYNSELSNLGFSEKQKLGKDKGGYKDTNLYLNGDLKKKDGSTVSIKSSKKWTDKEIELRTDCLVDLCIDKLYPIDK